MSDYKRFVAYLYEYHENSKGENRGFVRVEARSGTCQMAFQLKVISLPEGTPLNVYGFVRIREFLFGIPVGILRAGKGGISGRLLAPSVHMGDSSFSLDDLSGLLITGPEGRVYATQWDDIPILPDHFTTDASILQAPRTRDLVWKFRRKIRNLTGCRLLPWISPRQRRRSPLFPPIRFRPGPPAGPLGSSAQTPYFFLSL